MERQLLRHPPRTRAGFGVVLYRAESCRRALGERAFQKVLTKTWAQTPSSGRASVARQKAPERNQNDDPHHYAIDVRPRNCRPHQKAHALRMVGSVEG